MLKSLRELNLLRQHDIVHKQLLRRSCMNENRDNESMCHYLVEWMDPTTALSRLRVIGTSKLSFKRPLFPYNSWILILLTLSLGFIFSQLLQKEVSRNISSGDLEDSSANFSSICVSTSFQGRGFIIMTVIYFLILFWRHFKDQIQVRYTDILHSLDAQ